MHFYSQKNIIKLEKYLGVKKIPWEHEKRLWGKVGFYNKYFTKVPWVLGIAVCNSLAMNTAHKDSDIDLFIITKKNRLWTARICMTLLLTVLGQRKTRSKHKWKFCLSFFVTQDWLDLESIALWEDIYLSYWIDTLKPIINRQNIFEEFYRKNNKLLWKNTPWDEKNRTWELWKTHRFSTSFWDYCEKLLRFIFFPRTKKSFQKLWKPFWVVISDTMLKFHDKDRRKEIQNIISS